MKVLIITNDYEFVGKIVYGKSAMSKKNKIFVKGINEPIRPSIFRGFCKVDSIFIDKKVLLPQVNKYFSSNENGFLVELRNVLIPIVVFEPNIYVR